MPEGTPEPLAEDEPDVLVPIADPGVLEQTAALEHELVGERPVAIGALLVSTAMLRTGTVSAGAAVGFFLGEHHRAVYAGAITAVQAVSEMIWAPILARFADRFGRSKFLVGGSLVGGVGVLLLSLAVQPQQFALARILEGMGAAAFVPTALGTIAAATSHDSRLRAKASAAFEGANLAGYALGFALAGFVWHSFHSRGFVILAMFYLVAAFVCGVFLPRVPPLPVSPLRTVIRAVVGRGPIRSFLPAWMAAFGLIGSYGANLPALLKQGTGSDLSPTQTLVHHLDERVIGGVLTFWVVLLVAGIALWTPVLVRLGAVRTMRRCIPGAWILSVGLLALNHTPLGSAYIFLPIISGGILLLAGFGPAAVTFLAECSETFTADRSALMSFYTVTLAAGGAIGALAGAAAQAFLQVDGLVFLGIGLSVFTFFSLRPVVRYERAMAHEIDTPVG